MDAPGVEGRIAALLARRHAIGQGAVPPSRSDHLYSRGDPGGALLYSALFAPELAEVGGCVLLKDLGVRPVGGWEEVAAGVGAARSGSPERLKRYVDSFN